MSEFATQNVHDFLSSAKKEEVDWYLTRGEPQCLAGDFIDNQGNFVTRLYPGLRGVVVGEVAETREEAITKAAESKSKMMERADKFIAFDEAQKGIDDEAYDLQELFDQNLIRLENIVHIGTMQDGSLAEPLTDMIECFAYGDVSVLEELPFLKELLKDEDTEYEDIVQNMREKGYVGFLILASIPEQRPQQGGSTRIMYSSRLTNIFYASTFAFACKKAVEWAKKETERMRSAESE